MAQVIDRTVGAKPTGFDMRMELNNIIGALETCNSGTSEPLNTVQFMHWFDTSNATYYYLKQRNHDNTAWNTILRYTVDTKRVELVSNEVVINDSNLVHKTGNETIAGVKTLTDGLKLQNQNVSPFSGFKNYIINGKKAINQRGLSSTDKSYNQDRWYKAGNNWYQGIEGYNNLVNGKTYTLSWTGTAIASYYVGTATSNTINDQTFTPIVNGGSFNLTIAPQQNLWIKFGSDATGSTFNFVQLEEGSAATPFEHRPYGLELSLCQRYYKPWRHTGGVEPGSATQLSLTVPDIKSMRVTPTLTNKASGDGSGSVKSTYGSSASEVYFPANCCISGGESIVIMSTLSGLTMGVGSISIVGTASAEL